MYTKYFFVASSLLMMAACQDDLTQLSPEVEQGKITYKLHQPESPDSVYTITKETLAKPFTLFEADKPDFGIPLTPTYAMQLSVDKDFATAIDLTSRATLPELTLGNEEVNWGLNALVAAGKELNFSDTLTVYFRMKAQVSNSTNNPVDQDLMVKPSFSTGVSLQVFAFEQALQAALPSLYYVVGSPNGWGEGFPMSLVDGAEYDDETGKGQFTYTGFFAADAEFKLRNNRTAWEGHAFGSTDGTIAGVDFNAGENIKITEEGYYQINLDSQREKVTIEMLDPEDLTLPTFTEIGLVGSINGWDPAAAKAMDLAGDNPWIFTIEQKFTEDSEVKFVLDGAWGGDWGGKGFPYSSGVSGDNIKVPAGNYQIVINALEQTYFFFEK